MKMCAGNNTYDWGFDSIFEIECPKCGYLVEFFQDEITRRCSKCNDLVKNNRGSYGCSQFCSSNSLHRRNLCPKFKRSKSRFIGHLI
ncbi:MAG: hypothetical protein GY714_16290 [Desulfobacterales bacterium]|nr:hypothetical protein [Desulfobacterales bacterium]MCP4163081.1 hypothetical protein [Deltaproteobacteria bacterium]